MYSFRGSFPSTHQPSSVFSLFKKFLFFLSEAKAWNKSCVLVPCLKPFYMSSLSPKGVPLLYIEDDMRVLFCSSVLNVSKKKEVARNHGLKKIQEKKDFNWAASGRLGFRTILLDAFGLVQFEPTPKQESPMLRENKKQGDSTYKFVYLKV
jgi:hypothetical protein